MLWQVTNKLNHVYFQFFKKNNTNFIESFQKQMFSQFSIKKKKSKSIKNRFKKFLKPYKINRFLINHYLMRDFTLNYNNIKKLNLKKFTKKYGIKWFEITIYLKFLKLSLKRKNNLKQYMILRKKIRYSNKKKKKKVFLRKFKTKRDRYNLKDWRKWKRIFVGKYKYSYSRKFFLKSKNHYSKYNFYNLDKKIFLYVNDRKNYDIPWNPKLQDSSENFTMSESLIDYLQYFSKLFINQSSEIFEEYCSKLSPRWYKRQKILKIKNKPKLTKSVRRRVKKKRKLRRPIYRFHKKFKQFFKKPLKYTMRKKKMRKLRNNCESSRSFNVLTWNKRSSLKNHYVLNKKSLLMHYIKIQNNKTLKSSFQSPRQLLNFYYLNSSFKEILKEKQYINIKTLNDYITCLNKNIYKIKKKILITLISEGRIRHETLNFKKKYFKPLLHSLKIKRIFKFFVKIAPKYKVRMRTETYKNRFIKSNFYQDLMNKSWKLRAPIIREEMRFFLSEKKLFSRIKKKLLNNDTLRYSVTKTNNSLLKLKKKKTFSINDYMFLNYESLESYYLKFYLKEFKTVVQKNVKSKKKKIFFFNFNTEKLSTYREARKTHWKFFNKKTLRSSRYQKFLNFFLKKTNLFFNKIFTYFQFKFKFSYQFWINFNYLYQSFYQLDSNYKKIFQLPIHKLFWRFLKEYSIHGIKSSIKISDWQNRRVRIKRTFWMQQKLKLPKYLKKKNFNIEGITNSIQYDFITNYFIILKNFKKFDHTDLFIFKNKYIKLHGFKYKS